MNINKNEYIKQWLIKVNEDVLVIEELSKENPEYYTSAICYHSQQAIEKFLKAFLIFKDIEFKKTHNLEYLLALCLTSDDKDFLNFDFKNLTASGIKTRYPDDFIIPTLIESLQYKNMALEIKSVIENKIILI